MIQEITENVLGCDYVTVDFAIVCRIVLNSNRRESVNVLIEPAGINNVGKFETRNIAAERRAEKSIVIEQRTVGNNGVEYVIVLSDEIANTPACRSMVMADIPATCQGTVLIFSMMLLTNQAHFPHSSLKDYPPKFPAPNERQLGCCQWAHPHRTR